MGKHREGGQLSERPKVVRDGACFRLFLVKRPKIESKKLKCCHKIVMQCANVAAVHRWGIDGENLPTKMINTNKINNKENS